jgi:aryl-alcohol dehydrogenase-like predicted oxidoreductase
MGRSLTACRVPQPAETLTNVEDMQQRRLGASGLRVSRLALGTMTWGRATDEHEAKDILAAYVDAGGSFIDSAAGYGEGAAETLLGALIGGFVDREDLVIATKAGISRRKGARSVNTARGHLIPALDASLRRMGVDHVDLWQVHVWSDQTPIEETLSALDYAVATGRASYVGVSNYTGWQMAQAATWQMAVPGRARLSSTQVEYSLINRDIEFEVSPAATALGLGILPWSPLASGTLTGKYRTGTPSASRGATSEWGARVESYLDERGRAIIEAVCRAAEGLEWTPAQVALTWVRDRPGVAAPILGARDAVQVRSLLEVEDLTLPAEIRAALDDVSDPGLG